MRCRVSRPRGGPIRPSLPLRALFDQRIDGDDALLRLARLRFAQAGLAAETYADSPGRLEWILGFVAPHPRLPVVHLNRDVNLLSERGRAVVAEFAARFAGRVGAWSSTTSPRWRPTTDDSSPGCASSAHACTAGRTCSSSTPPG